MRVRINRVQKISHEAMQIEIDYLRASNQLLDILKTYLYIYEI